MSHFILIHGAAHGGWAWYKVRAILEQKGHTVIAPDLPGHSATNRVPAHEVTLERYVSAVVDLVNSCDGKVILAGHSMGGIVVSLAAQRVKEKIQQLFFVAALVPRPGDTIKGLLDRDKKSKLKKCFTVNADGMHAVLVPDTIDRFLYNGCNDDDIVFAKKRLVPQPLAPMTEVIDMELEYFKKVWKTGIVCTNDRSLHRDLQEIMYMRAGCRLDYLPSGHMPLFSHDEEIARMFEKWIEVEKARKE
ncbi:MAG: alpha/beta fold hydrolase [Chitinispirillaceae bacterium]|nr:alpha/beta fold hydrolase [Chitinispirillaceae bacterium]